MRITAHFKIFSETGDEYEDRIIEGSPGAIDIQLAQVHDGIAAIHSVDPEQVELIATSRWVSRWEAQQ